MGNTACDSEVERRSESMRLRLFSSTRWVLTHLPLGDGSMATNTGKPPTIFMQIPRSNRGLAQHLCPSADRHASPLQEKLWERPARCALSREKLPVKSSPVEKSMPIRVNSSAARVFKRRPHLTPRRCFGSRCPCQAAPNGGSLLSSG